MSSRKIRKRAGARQRIPASRRPTRVARATKRTSRCGSSKFLGSRAISVGLPGSEARAGFQAPGERADGGVAGGDERHQALGAAREAHGFRRGDDLLEEERTLAPVDPAPHLALLDTELARRLRRADASLP